MTADIYPEINISDQEIKEFNVRLHSSGGHDHLTKKDGGFVSFVKKVARRWVNMSSSLDPDMTQMHLSFQKWFFIHHLFKVIEEKRER